MSIERIRSENDKVNYEVLYSILMDIISNEEVDKKDE